MNINENMYYQMVREFHKAFNHPVAEQPTIMDVETALNRMSWDAEESLELLHASSETIEEFQFLYLKLLANMKNTYEQLLKTEFPEDRLSAQVDALCDKEYFNQGSFVMMGVKPDRVVEAVHNSNMSKLWNGVPKFREEDGKIIKSDTFVSPEPMIKKEIERQQVSSK
ncbi:HAD family hydrolase [Paenibacillus chitinolyticus]|uniref:HAD family hydrolase n=1 Tax=Paenibacillus chitinolyticus TaxID=79263 RepID=A0A410WX65_9BACL|nr:hypothetical protein [Paenibacillus chitinolyticus]MCY9592327.1 HAD family hydrolase [Paenibacillus chitinolyticus]MCY9599789.1 HAD family hydrolase [Paenibacillus chitinolyticus]QAV18933.1 HAD family hydrolase [Paenibacillus chitinolyticus]